MKIGLISDTHIPESFPELPEPIMRGLAGSDLIFHAGDLHITEVLDQLESLAPVICSRGNGDREIKGDQRIHPSYLLEVHGVTIGLVHELLHPYLPLSEAVDRDFGRHVDIIVSGHTHMLGIQRVDRSVLVNPGSATYPFNLDRQIGTIGLLDVTDTEITIRLVRPVEESDQQHLPAAHWVRYMGRYLPDTDRLPELAWSRT